MHESRWYDIDVTSEMRKMLKDVSTFKNDNVFMGRADVRDKIVNVVQVHV